MDTEQFLARVIAPGNYAAINFKTPGKGMGVRFFPRDALSSAAGFVSWASDKGMDVYHAVASYRMGVPDGTDSRGAQKFTGTRTQENVQALRCFWADLDIKRPGDGKDPAKVYADVPAAITWLRGFLATTSLAPPNLWVQSGYGLHLYWVLEDALAPADWQPYAEALKAALLATKATLDVGITTDSARILRPPGTANHKDPGRPMPVRVLANQSRSDYPNDLILQALQPYVGVIQARATGTHSGSAQVLGMGTVSPLFAGRQSGTSASAQANLPARRDFAMAEIARKCLQVKQSLAAAGAGDPYPLWYLGHLSLAHFCADGAQHVHAISVGDPRYTPAATDAAVARIAQEKATKGGGAPTCRHYDSARPGVCQGCPHFGKLNSPLTLGVDSDGDLPDRYRRQHGALQVLAPTKDGPSWSEVVIGDVYAPALDTNYNLRFTYERAGTPHEIFFDYPQFLAERGGPAAYFARFKATVGRTQAPLFGDFAVAWIEKLRDLRVGLNQDTPPFGWLHDHAGTSTGLAIGGTVYRRDGTVEQPAQPAQGVVALYQPAGRLEPWKAAADFVCKGRVDLQAVVAASFGAPLMRFTDQPGLAISVWSRDSAVGKSSAFLVAQTVWAERQAMCSMGDTVNSVRTKVGAGRVMPCFWDEIQIDPNKPEEKVNFFFDIAQGRDKARLDSSAQLRETREWQTLFVCSGNTPLMEHIVRTRSSTDAGAVRCFEMFLDRPRVALDPAAAPLIGECQRHYGHAGRIYAAWLAQHEVRVQARVRALSDQLVAETNAPVEERFFVAGIACMLTGAQIARQLGLVAFDVVGLHAHLRRHLLNLREARNHDLIVNNGMFDLVELFARFAAWAAPRRLITSHYNAPGARPDPRTYIVLAPHRTSDHLIIHIGQRDLAMRIERQAFDGWCKSQGFSATEVWHQMQARWGASELRTILGMSTEYSTARVKVISIPLQHPDLEGYVGPTLGARNTTVVKPSPAQALKAPTP